MITVVCFIIKVVIFIVFIVFRMLVIISFFFACNERVEFDESISFEFLPEPCSSTLTHGCVVPVVLSLTVVVLVVVELSCDT